MLLLFWGLAAIPFYSRAQEASSWAIIGLEIPSYTGDLNRYAQFNSGFTAGFRLNQRKNLNGQFLLSVGTLKGDNRRLDILPGSESPNTFFRTSFIEVTYQLHYYLLQRNHFRLYAGIGAGFLRFQPMDNEGTPLSDLPGTRAGNETYRNITLALPVKLGGQYIFDNQFGVSFEAGWHNPLTDYLDNISELGNGGLDNILFLRVNLMVPLGFKTD
ncbi:MAG: hypothetical protein P8X57_01100 [Cyclobacteriaceae bacterium]